MPSAKTSGSQYTLDLDSIVDFPDCAHVPVFPPDADETWYTLCEIIDSIGIGRPVFRVRDKLPGNYWTVAFYTDDPRQDAVNLKCEIGSTMCIKNSRIHHFLDGQVGYRIEDISTVTVLPCSISQLMALGSELRQRSDAGYFQCCVVCDKPAQHRCAACRTRYCSRECQRPDWKIHKRSCAALKALLEWNDIFA